MGLLMDLFGKQATQLGKYYTEVVYEITYVVTYKDGSKGLNKIQLKCGLNGIISLKETCRQIKSANENIAKVKILTLEVKRIAENDNVIYERQELW